ncbi:Histidine--tRNA ligase [Candidatus Methylacidithermus pantelleriae]|uniref:Histidine--tRNA ligase n=2 Tax=Candidatus Methylacidithermus pantelleriae TaxID=2744239 RepID=A0A8J2BL11_9BACT|nr:Histidine--tRNA ligase [Candidatus Methylacidithermus pantelleriae]
MQALPGFRDFYPEDLCFRNRILEAWRRVARRYGFVEYDGPPLEPLEIYAKKSGGELLDQLYRFVDRGGREVALRAEMTPTLARMIARGHKQYKKPIKWFSIPQLFRYERMQRGRLREHFQFNCDIIGEPSLEAECELIALAIDTLRELGLQEEDFVVRVSDRLFWADLLGKLGVDPEEWTHVLQVIDKSEREPYEVTVQRLGKWAQPILSVLEEKPRWPRLQELLDRLAWRGMTRFVEIDLRVVRGLAYYTGIVFEIFDRQRRLRAIAGGGRYDDLVPKFGGEPLPAAGFGMGDVVLGELLREKLPGRERCWTLDAYLVLVNEDLRPAAAALLQSLREAGLGADYPLSVTSVRKQLELAEERGCRYALFLDERWCKGLVGFKKLKATEEGAIPVDKIVPFLRERC